jgi:hypothetical protein
MLNPKNPKHQVHVCLGMADKPASTIFDDYILGKRGVAFLW